MKRLGNRTVITPVTGVLDSRLCEPGFHLGYPFQMFIHTAEYGSVHPANSYSIVNVLGIGGFAFGCSPEYWFDIILAPLYGQIKRNIKTPVNNS